MTTLRSQLPPWRLLLLQALLVAALAAALLRLPVPIGLDPLSAHRALLYETLRLGSPWSSAAVGLDGPLAAVQTPVYVGGSIWMAMTWQIAGNLFLAALLVAAAFRLRGGSRIAALILLGVTLARWPELAPWLVLLLLGHDLVAHWERDPAKLIAPAALMGFLGLFSLGHFACGLLTLATLALSFRPGASKLVALAAWCVGAVVGWLVLGQPLTALAAWLAQGTSLLAQTSPSLRFTDVSGVAALASAVTLLLIAGFAWEHFRRAPATVRLSWSMAAFWLGALWLAWRTLALGTFGTPVLFFGSVLLAGFALVHHHRVRRRLLALPFALALIALAKVHPDFALSPIGHLNRQIVFNVRELSRAGELRNSLRAHVAAIRQAFGWKEIPTRVGNAPVAVLGDALPRTLLAGLKLHDASASWQDGNAPEFVVQGVPVLPTTSPALVDARRQLTLLRGYEIALEENGFVLWRRREGANFAALPEVEEHVAYFGREQSLPAEPNTAYWLEIDLTPSVQGWLRSLIGDTGEAGIVLRDAQGAGVRYALPAGSAHGEVLLAPLFRGREEFAAWTTGGAAFSAHHFTIVPPADSTSDWNRRYRYRLHALPALQPAGRSLAARPAGYFRSFGRPPIGTATEMPFAVSEGAPADTLFFAAPTSALEFPIRRGDRRVSGRFGIAPGGYQKPGATDGADFSAEFVGLDGRRVTLHHRYLNPLSEPGDRGTQSFTADLPPEAEGRLVLRTFNPPHRTPAWDWAFWQNVVIE